MSHEIKVGDAIVFKWQSPSERGYEIVGVMEGVVLKIGKSGKALLVNTISTGTGTIGSQIWITSYDVIDVV